MYWKRDAYAYIDEHVPDHDASAGSRAVSY